MPAESVPFFLMSFPPVRHHLLCEIVFSSLSFSRRGSFFFFYVPLIIEIPCARKGDFKTSCLWSFFTIWVSLTIGVSYLFALSDSVSTYPDEIFFLPLFLSQAKVFSASVPPLDDCPVRFVFFLALFSRLHFFISWLAEIHFPLFFEHWGDVKLLR